MLEKEWKIGSCNSVYRKSKIQQLDHSKMSAPRMATTPINQHAEADLFVKLLMNESYETPITRNSHKAGLAWEGSFSIKRTDNFIKRPSWIDERISLFRNPRTLEPP